MYQSSTPYGQEPYRSAPVAAPMRAPYTGGHGVPARYNAAMQNPQHQPRFTSPPQQAGGFRQPQPQPYAQQYSQQGQGYTQPRSGDTGRSHKGTLPPGQMVRVGQHAVRVERYLSEGGYAHVYLTSSDKPIYPPKRSSAKGRWGEKGYTTHCLKRIAFEDESVWRDVSREIEVMKALPPSQYLIQYLDSSHHRLPNGTHEVFILMEFCSGGGIIDLLNKRLRDRLKEIEILNIFTDVCEAVAAMHAMNRPLLHRDLKIENVLSHPNGMSPTPQRPTPLVFKLCDFGSTTFPATHPPQTKAEADARAMDLNKHTTLQYRSPEMVEPMLGWAVGLPSDVWALGVLLYKLCYYTTPFEEHGTLAIVNAKYTFPQYPVYSPRLQHLIASMLVEHPSRRPSVFEVLRMVHEMSGTRSEVDYPMPNRQLPAALPPSPKKAKAPANVLDFTSGNGAQARTPVQQPSLTASVQPQRRGRPTRPESMKATPHPQQPQQSQVQQPPPPQLPRMPVPASTTGPARATKMQVTGEASLQGANLQHSISLSRRSVSGTKPPMPVLARLQGSAFDGSPAWSQTSTPKGAVDAFGLSKTRITPSPGGFGDSFSVLAPPPNDSRKAFASRTGSDDAFGAATGDAFGMPTKFSSGNVASSGGFGDSFGSSFAAAGPPPPKLPKPTRGFTDSFSAPPVPTKVSPASTRASLASPQKSGHAARPSSSSTRRSQEATTSPGGETSFEQRFPSLEALTGEDSSPAKAPFPPVLSPTTQPLRMKRMSISMANLTGDNSKASRLSVPMQPPHPRSTHVTGTAFKDAKEGTLKSPTTNVEAESATADYLSLLDDEVKEDAPRPPECLFGDNDESLSVALAPLRPTVSNTSSLGSRWGISPTQTAAHPAARPPPPMRPKPQATPNKTLGASQRATLPDMSSSRPATNFNSVNWSPLQSMKTPSPPVGDDSSDDERAPESPDGRFRHPSSPGKSGIVHPPSPGIARRMAAYQQQATTGPSTSPPKPGYGTWSGRSTRTTRPQSMYDARSSASGALSPPLVSVRSGSPGSQGSGSRTPEGSHGRRSSINDIVSRYEALNTTGGQSPVKESFVNGNCNRASIFSKPAPPVASKPPGLGVSRAPPAVASKPAGLRDREASGTSVDYASAKRDRTGTSEKEKSAPAPKPKPDLAPKPKTSKPDLAAAAKPITSLWRRSSKPELAPKPPVFSKRAETLPAPLEDASQGSGRSSPSSSPEKQQPVNLLIQRWNQGGLKKS